MKTTLGTAIIYTARLRELAEFYRSGFELPEPIPMGPDHLGFELGEFYLGFDQVRGIAGRSPGAVSLWFTVDDLGATYERLLALGAKSKYPPTDKPWGGRLAAVFDLDGNLLGLSQRR